MANEELINKSRLSQIRISKFTADRPFVKARNGTASISVSHKMALHQMDPNKIIAVVTIKIEGEDEDLKSNSPEFSLLIEARGIIKFQLDIRDTYKELSFDQKELLIQPIYLYSKNYAEIILNAMNLGNVGLEIDIRSYRDLESTNSAKPVRKTSKATKSKN